MLKTKTQRGVLPVLLGLLVAFGTLARAAHDLWSSTLIYLVTLAVFVTLVSTGRLKRTRTWPWLLLIGAFAISTAHAVNPGEALWELCDWIAAGLLFCIARSMAAEEGDGLDSFLAVCALGLWVQPGLILYQKWDMGPQTYLTDDAPGTLVNAAVGAGFMLFWIPVFFVRLRDFWADNRKVHGFWLCGLAAALLNLLFYASTAGFLCVLLLLPLGLARIRRRPRLALLVYGGIFLVGALLVFAKYQSVFSSISWSHNQPQTSRLFWWESAIWMFRDHPWFGIGLGNFPSAYLAYKVGPGQNTLYPHSFLLGLLAETGLVGTLALLLLVGAVLSSRPWRRTSTEDKRGQRISFLIAAGVFLLYAAISVGWEYFLNLMTFWIFLGIATSSRAAEVWKPPRVIVILLVGVGLLSAVYLVSFFASSQALVAGDFQRAAALNPYSWEAHQGLARQNAIAGNIPGAIDHQKQAIERNRLNSRLHWELGHYYKQAGDRNAARAALSRALELHKNNNRIQVDLEALNAS